MDKTLLSLFEKSESDFRKELSLIQLPRDYNKLQNIFNDFFISNTSIEEYKKELTLDEIALLNSVMKVVSIPISLINDNENETSNEGQIDNKRDFLKSFFDTIDVKTLGSTAAGGLIGGLLLRTWGGVALSLAGCAIGSFFSSYSVKEQKQVYSGIDVDKYISTLKGIYNSIDEVIINYQASITNVIKQYEAAPKMTLASAYKPLLNRLASLYVSVESAPLPDDVRSEFDKLYRTLKNQHYEVLGYNEDTKQYFIETESAHVKEIMVIKAAILENGKLLETGECLTPKK